MAEPLLPELPAPFRVCRQIAFGASSTVYEAVNEERRENVALKLFHAQLTGDEQFLERSLNSWRFTKNYILDKSNGEWVWGIRENYSVMDKEKVGIWKCPYHNSRACMQLIHRINKIRSGG